MRQDLCFGLRSETAQIGAPRPEEEESVRAFTARKEVYATEPVGRGRVATGRVAWSRYASSSSSSCTRSAGTGLRALVSGRRFAAFLRLMYIGASMDFRGV